MFLKLTHKEMDIYKVSKLFVIACYQLTNTFPPEEKFNMISQIRRAALSVQLNIAEGGERRRFYEIARGSIIEIDAALDIATELKYIIKEELKKTWRIVSQMLSNAYKND